MKSIVSLLTFLLVTTAASFAQHNPAKKTFSTATLGIAAGSSGGSASVAYNYHWQLGKKQKFDIGLGIRNTTGFGTKQEHVTATASLARTNSIPFLIVFAGQRPENLDTLTVQRPFTNSLNAMIQLGYRFSDKFSAGFNIDLLGFTIGRKTSAILTSNGITQTEPTAKPTAFNVLLTGDLDKGSLNSEFFLQYLINKKWGIRAVYQYVFSEYNTSSIKQVAANGTIVTRFRQKANNLGIGIAYNF